MKPAAPKREAVTRKTAPPNGIPWQWGYDAARDGYPFAACPFHVGTPSADQWISGYAAAGHAAGLKDPS